MKMKNRIDTKTILVIEDNEDMREILIRALKPEGYNVILADSFINVISILENSHIDLIILDLMLPWLDGFSICYKIKSNEKFQNIPILIISARSSEEDINKGYSLGCSKYMTKPFLINDLYQSVKELVPAGQG